MMLGKTEGRRRRARQRKRWLDASLTRWTWVWVSSRSWWWIGKPGVLKSMGLKSQIWLSDWTELAWNDPLVSIFSKSSLVFPILLFSSISLHWSLRKAFISLLDILWNSELKWVYLSFSPLPLVSLLSSAICKTSSDNHFAFCISSWGWSWSLPLVQCHKPPSIVLQALYHI